MKHTLLIKVALCAAIMLASTGANASSKDFKHTTVIIFAEEDSEASLVVIDGKLDMAQLMEQMSKEN